MKQSTLAASPQRTPKARVSEGAAWLKLFAKRKGRPLRVLHVGNIANNAYLNAKFLRSVGVDAHVLSYDYTHVMAMPEWEDVELVSGHGDDYRPHFSRRDLKGYRRPRWFFQGSLGLCIQMVEARFGTATDKARLKAVLLLHQPIRLIAKHVSVRLANLLSLMITQPRLAVVKALGFLSRRWTTWTDWRPSFGSPLARRISRWSAAPTLRSRSSASQKPNEELEDPLPLTPDLLDESLAEFIARFRACFPQRADQMSRDELLPYFMNARVLRLAFKHYDIVQCYATEPGHALLSGTRPYVGFEHGTLRDFTMGDNPLHRLTSLGYRQADHCFITNGDCLEYARRLEVPHFSPVIHPIDVDQHRQDFGQQIKRLRASLGGDMILFCPIRHDWAVKGTDVHLRALPDIKRRAGQKVRLVLVDWGLQVEDSKRLIESLGCTQDVVWRSSMCRITMIKHIRAADVVLDQMALPHFGATAPQSLAAGTPVISSYNPESTRWIIPEPAPILPAHSSEEVADAVIKALDPEWRLAYQERARHWVDTYHHPDNVIADHIAVYRRILENVGSSGRA